MDMATSTAVEIYQETGWLDLLWVGILLMHVISEVTAAAAQVTGSFLLGLFWRSICQLEAKLDLYN